MALKRITGQGPRGLLFALRGLDQSGQFSLRLHIPDPQMPWHLRQTQGGAVRNNDSLSEDEIEQIMADRAKADEAAALREEDYQLAYAIDILKGLSALGNKD